MTKNIPHLYSKMLLMMERISDRGKTDTSSVRLEVSRKFKISSADIEICLNELQKKRLLKLNPKACNSDRASIFIKQGI